MSDSGPSRGSATQDLRANAAGAVGEEFRAKSVSENLLRRRHAGRRVLLVEDNAVNREVAEELLRSTGLRVDAAEDGLVAVARACERSYDVILMDIVMPEMGGIEATKQIRKLCGESVPIIAMTAHAFVEDRRTCLNAGMNDHLAKPVDPGALFATLLRWLPLHASAVRERMPHSILDELPTNGFETESRLRLVPDLEFETGLRNVGGRTETLFRILGRFASVYERGVPALLDSSQARYREDWRTICHSLGGACAAIGATRLAQLAEEMDREEVAGRSDASMGESGLRLHSELVALTQALVRAL